MAFFLDEKNICDRLLISTTENLIMNLGKMNDVDMTYWNHSGRHQEFQNRLETLIPTSGEVSNAKQNRALELYRKAGNCYYDLYNNGLCNRRQEFYSIFKLKSARHSWSRRYNRMSEHEEKTFLAAVESKMDELILAAYLEQTASVFAK